MLRRRDHRAAFGDERAAQPGVIQCSGERRGQRHVADLEVDGDLRQHRHEGPRRRLRRCDGVAAAVRTEIGRDDREPNRVVRPAHLHVCLRRHGSDLHRLRRGALRQREAEGRPARAQGIGRERLIGGGNHLARSDHDSEGQGTKNAGQPRAGRQSRNLLTGDSSRRSKRYAPESRGFRGVVGRGQRLIGGRVAFSLPLGRLRLSGRLRRRGASSAAAATVWLAAAG